MRSNPITTEPVLVQTLVLAIINMLLVFGVIHWTTDQIASVNAVLVAVLGIATRALVTPTANADLMARLQAILGQQADATRSPDSFGGPRP